MEDKEDAGPSGSKSPSLEAVGSGYNSDSETYRINPTKASSSNEPTRNSSGAAPAAVTIASLENQLKHSPSRATASGFDSGDDTKEVNLQFDAEEAEIMENDIIKDTLQFKKRSRISSFFQICIECSLV
jgi:hypothetical protein